MKIIDIEIEKCDEDFTESLAECVQYMKRDLSSLPRLIGQFVLWGEKANFIQLIINRDDDEVTLSLSERGQLVKFAIVVKMIET